MGPVLGGPRRSRDRARIAAVAVVAVVVLAIGIGVLGNGPIGQSESTAPTLPTSSTATESEPVAAGSVPPTASGPTPAASSCALVRPGHPHDIRVSSGGPPQQGVAPTPAPSGEPVDEAAWPVPSIELAARVGVAEGVNLLADLDACVQFVSAEYAPADASASGPFPITWHTMEISPPRAIVPLGPLPEGDWIVRVSATFLDFLTTPTSIDSTEQFFRVIVGSGVRPSEPAPEVTPAVHCVPWNDSSQPPDLVLTGTEDQSVPGIPPGTGTPPLTYGTMGSPIEIRTSGDGCALAWSITAFNVDTNRSVSIESQDNAAYDPFLAAQNRWLLSYLPTGLLQMTATMHYSADVSVTRRWDVIIEPPDFPAVVFRAPDGTTATGAPACGAQWGYPDATGGEVSCTGNPILANLEELDVAPGSVIRVDVPGWTVASWAGSCGVLDPSVSPSKPFVVIEGCGLGSGQGPVEIGFVSRSAASVVQLDVTLLQQGQPAVVSGTVYVSIVPTP